MNGGDPMPVPHRQAQAEDIVMATDSTMQDTAETWRWVHELSAHEQALWRLRKALEQSELMARPVIRLFR
jgi:hypothetical protein